MSDLRLVSVLKTPYASETNLFEPDVSDSKIEVALDDSDGKINPEFHVPAVLRKPVEFWLKVYTRYTTQQQVIFDSRHPNIVYQVLDFSDIAKKARNAVVYEILRARRLKKVMRAYRIAFDRLASRRRRRGHVLPEERRILAALRHMRHHPAFRELKKDLRSQTGQRDNVMKGLLAAETFFPRMERIFRRMGVPPELTRLSLVESSFDLRAYSRTGAVGVWQFMPGPGRKLLMINDRAGIDERLSPLKSTVAAARLLRQNYRQFRNWALAVTSYNHGLRGLMQYRRSHRKRKFSEFARIFEPSYRKSPLGWAARNYYAEFLAILHAETYRKIFYGDVPEMKVMPVVYRQVRKRQSALSFAMKNGIALLQLRRANPDIRNVNGRLPVGFWLALPGEKDNLTGLTRRRTSRGSHRRKAYSIARARKRDGSA